MAILVGKGSLLKVTISSVLTSVPGLKKITIGAQDPETFESRTLDGSAAIPKASTGYFSQGDVTAEGYYDPTNSVWQFITTNSQTPFTSSIACSVVMTDAAPKSATFNAVGFGIGPINYEMSDGVQTTVTIKTAGAVTLPTS